MTWSDKARQAAAIARAKKYGANKRRSAAATRNAYAKVSDADFKAIMRGDKKPKPSAIQKRKGAKLPKKNKTPLQQARDIRVNHKSASSRPTFGTGGKKYPSSVLGSQGSPAKGSAPGRPMAAPGVAKPTGPHAFTPGSGGGLRGGGHAAGSQRRKFNNAMKGRDPGVNQVKSGSRNTNSRTKQLGVGQGITRFTSKQRSAGVRKGAGIKRKKK